MNGPGQTGAANEPWSFGDDVYQILRQWLVLRERLRPSIMTAMRAAHEEGLPPMRPLFLNFPGDETAWGIDDEFLLGDDILVAPIVTAGATERRVYLPEADWRDAWTGERTPGGQWVTSPAPLHRIPVYVRDHRLLDPFRAVLAGIGGL
jgi:alpha-D-xyloside xylohydrolase